MEYVEKINAEMEVADKTCPKCRMPFSAKDVIGIGVHFVDCRADERIVKEPLTFYVVRCPQCRLRGTCDSLMNKQDMVDTAGKVWDEMICLSWLTYKPGGAPTTEFVQERKEESLARFFTFTRDLSEPEAPTEQEKD